ncbi:MAG TPA: hypothetical protein VHM88_21245 [Candidatus Acidoferrales bacterium]|nr:hypothetical protein [Candidatus Acidoferrales bacterium]
MNVSYAGKQDEKKDGQLHNLAERFHGEFTGAAYSFGNGGERNTQFAFKDPAGAKAFESAARQLGFQVLMAAKR